MTEPNKRTKKQASDATGTKGCLILALAAVGIGALVYLLSSFSAAIKIPKIIWFSDSGIKIEWPFGKQEDKTRDEKDGGNGEKSPGTGGPVAADTDSGAVESSAQIETGQVLSAEYDILIGLHGDLLGAVRDYYDGSGGPDGFLTKLTEVNDDINKAIYRLNHINAGEYRSHLNLLTAAAMSDQIAASAVIKYLGAGSASAELDNPASDYNRNVGDASQAYAAFAELPAINPTQE